MSAPQNQVTLRQVTDRDADRLLDWRNSEAVAPFMYSDHRISPEEHARWLAMIQTSQNRIYWIIEWAGLPVGLVNLADIDRTHRRCSWAYYLADPAVRGRGVGSFVEYWIIEYVFNNLGLTKLWCEVLASNEAVWALHLQFGFEREALFRRHVYKGGRAHDVIGLGLLADEWELRRATMAERLRAKGHLVLT